MSRLPPLLEGVNHNLHLLLSPELSQQEIAGQSLLDTSVVPSDNREGPKLELFEDLRDLGIDANEMYGLSNMEYFKKIMLYLKQYCKLTPKVVQARGPA